MYKARIPVQHQRYRRYEIRISNFQREQAENQTRLEAIARSLVYWLVSQ